MINTSMTRRTAIGLVAGAATRPKSLLAQSPNGRPRYHLTPSSGWINDPQRAMKINGVWHLYVLYDDNYYSGTAWMHYTSTDLINWTEHGIAIPKRTNQYGDIWTGSTLYDPTNQFGFGAGAVLAFMTMPADATYTDSTGTHTVQNQSTALWISRDGGYNYSFQQIVLPNYPGPPTPANPFRDPSVFPFSTNHYVQSLTEPGKISVYSSSDMLHWSYRSGMLSNVVGGVMECPNMFKLHLYESDGFTTYGDKWVLLSGGNGSSSGFTNGTYYWVGSFDGSAFNPDSTNGNWLDYGPDFYATTVFQDPDASDFNACAYAIAWQNNWNYATSIPTVAYGYRGQLTMTRQLKLQKVNGNPVLLNNPLPNQNSVFTSIVPGTDQILSDQNGNYPNHYTFPAWPNSPAFCLDFVISRANGGSWPSGIYISVRDDSNYFTQVGFVTASNSGFIKRDTGGPDPVSGSSADQIWLSNRAFPVDFSGDVPCTIYVDAGSIEVFVNGGRAAASALITAPLTATGMYLNPSFGTVSIKNVTIKSMA